MSRDPNISKDHDGIYKLRVPVAGTTRRAWVSTGERDIRRARAVVEESGAEKLVALHNARCLTQETIALVTIGRRVTCTEVSTLWLEWARPRIAPATADHYAGTVRRMFEFHGTAAKPLNAISEADITRWINDGISKLNTRIMRMRALRSFYRFASAKGLCVGNPVELVEINSREMTVEQMESRHATPVSDEDYQRFITAYADGDEDNWRNRRITDRVFWRDATILSYCTGLRMVDCASLQWASFNAEEMIVYPLKTSGQKHRLVLPLNDPLIMRPELGELIGRLLAIPVARRDDPTYVWPVKAAAVQGPRRSGESRQYVAMMWRIGIQPGVSFHGLRAAFARRLRAAGRTLEEVARAMGHADSEITKTYTGEQKAAPFWWRKLNTAAQTRSVHDTGSPAQAE